MSSTKDEAGVAKIKEEYILHDYKPVLDTDYVSKEDQDQLEEKQTPGNDQEGGGEPPSKRVKLKGRNKQRPKGQYVNPADRLCPAIKDEKECKFNTRCKFCHDKEKFYAAKLPDLGPECYLYETYGVCPFGIACRYGKNHLSMDDLSNLKKEDVDSRSKRETTISNVLNKDLQVMLWKRRYDFSRADKVIGKLCKVDNMQKKFDNRRADRTAANADHAERPLSVVSDNKVSESASSASNVADTTVPSAMSPDTESVKPDSVADNGTTVDAVNSTSGEVSSSLEVKSVETQDVNNTLKLSGREMSSCRPQLKKKVDFSDKLYLAPLTTVGNLPFRRICKRLGADITCGEMAVCTNLLQGQQSEWALLKRHESEDIYGVQLCGAYPDAMTRCAQLITETMNVDFIDINCGCPIDLIFNKGEGSALMGRLSKFEQIVNGMTGVMDVPLTVKVRTGIYSDKNIAHTLMPKLRDWDVALTTIHGRSRVQRYTKTADWDYIDQCAKAAAPMPVFGNGDILSFEEANQRRQETGVSGLMIARGALIKPWVFTEIKEQRTWDISSSERLDLLRDYTKYGMDHWGSDTKGIENTRRFLLEWLSFLNRYIPVGLLERLPQRVNEKPPYYKGRDDLETLMASPNCGDWIKISEMLLGPVPDGFSFLPKHKANAYK